MTLPVTMKALVRSTAEWDRERPSLALELAERPVPVPARGEVLVKMEAVSCNPSDLAALAGFYATSQAPGEICGFEGCGRVVAAGPGLMGRYLTGKRVACATQSQNGLWAEYAVLPAQNCAPVGERLPLEAAAGFIVNPGTAWAFAEMVRKTGARAILLSAGASQVSRGVLALCRGQGVDVVLIVRRPAQVAEMKAAGAAEVLDQTADGFTERLREICARLRPTLFFDAVGDALTRTAMDVLPAGAEIIVYGWLDTVGTGAAQAPIPALIFCDMRVRGFWLPPYIAGLSLLKTLRVAADIRRLFEDGTFTTRVAGTCSLEAFPAAIDTYVSDMSAGKHFAVMGS
jgi:NADPH:quinone reductase-like Zn-dependent oxidoreductase